MRNSANSARIDLRLAPELKQFIQRSAESSGFATVSAFVLEAALEKAQSLVQRSQLISLSDADWQSLTSAIDMEAGNNSSLLDSFKSTDINGINIRTHT